MRIAYICADPGIPVFGCKGASIHVQEVIRALLKQGAEIDLFATRFDGDRPPGLEPIKLHALPAIGKGDPAQREQAALIANSGLSAALAAAQAENGSFDLIYERYSLWSYAGMTYAREQAIPGLLEVNAPLIEEQREHRKLIDRVGAEAVAHTVFGAATALIAVSQDIATYLEQFVGASGHIYVVPNGVDPERFPPDLTPAWPLSPKNVTIGFVGTLKAWHGLEALIDAFCLLYPAVPHLRLLIVGDGPCRTTLDRLVIERGISAAVHFTGAVEHAAVPRWLACMDIAVAPYPALENFYFSPLKVYEYMAAGLPVVASRIGQIANLIQDHENGLLYSAGDIRELTRSIDDLLADRELARQLGQRARQTILQGHTWDHVARRILAIAMRGSHGPISRRPPSMPTETMPTTDDHQPAPLAVVTGPSSPRYIETLMSSHLPGGMGAALPMLCYGSFDRAHHDQQRSRYHTLSRIFRPIRRYHAGSGCQRTAPSLDLAGCAQQLDPTDRVALSSVHPETAMYQGKSSASPQTAQNKYRWAGFDPRWYSRLDLRAGLRQIRTRIVGLFSSSVFTNLGQILRQFRPQIAGQWLLLVTALWSALIGVGLRLFEPWPLKLVVDYLSGHPLNDLPLGFAAYLNGLDASMLIALLAIVSVLIVSLRAGVSYLSTVTLALAGNRVLTQVRAALYHHLLHLPLSFHTRHKSGDLLTHLVGDIGRLQEVAVTAILPLVVNLLTLIGMVGMMCWLNWRLAVIALAVMPLSSLFTARTSGHLRDAARKQRKQEGALAATAAEALGAMRLVQAFSLETVLEQEFVTTNQKNLTEGVRTTRLSAHLERVVDVFVGIGVALAFWLGASAVHTGTLSLGDLVIFLSYLKNAFRPMNDLAKYTGRIAKAAASGERVLNILNTQPEIHDTANALPVPRLRGTIGFEQVNFSYVGGQPILQNIDLQVLPGQRVALVGPSGGGKSTLTTLLLRLYDPSSGCITIDGWDLRTFTLKSLRAQMSVVLQESLLFGVSVRENIAYGAPEVSQAQIEQAAQLANAHDFIMALPQGYSTILGERGGTLSGGQRQRIAIARAAVRQAPIIILDEPTTGLDQENEQVVYEALNRLVQGRTSFWVTHDLWAAEGADLILYIEGGIICERGSHTELLRLDGKYAAMYTQQATIRAVSSQPNHLSANKAQSAVAQHKTMQEIIHHGQLVPALAV